MRTKEQDAERKRLARARAKAIRQAAGAEAVEAAKLAVTHARAHLRDAERLFPQYIDGARKALKEAEAACRALGVRPPRSRKQIKAQTARQKAKRAEAATLAAQIEATAKRLRTAEENLRKLLKGSRRWRTQRRCIDGLRSWLERLQDLAPLTEEVPGAAWDFQGGTFERVQDVQCYGCTLKVGYGTPRDHMRSEPLSGWDATRSPP